jgi:hypothetical protein
MVMKSMTTIKDKQMMADISHSAEEFSEENGLIILASILGSFCSSM